MTTPLESTLDAIGRATNLNDVSALVERVGVDDTGRLNVELEAENRQRWFRWESGQLDELLPTDDPHLPSAKLAGERGVLSWRPGRRIVLSSALGEKGIVKGYRRRRSARAADNHRAAARASTPDGFRVPALVTHDTDEEALILERLEGSPTTLSRHDTELHLRIGDALRSWQETPTNGLDHFRLEEELALLQRFRQRTSLALGALPLHWEQTFVRASALASELPPTRPVLCHRDLHDGQIGELEDGRPTLLDFDTLCLADAALDPANLLAHYALRQFQGIRGADEDGVRACAEAFVEGLRPEGPGFWRRLRFYQVTSFLRLALVYTLRPRWKHLSDELVALADRCLSPSATT